MLDVTVYLGSDEPEVFTDVDYVSLVSPETWGAPALIAPRRQDEGGPRAKVDQSVLYINTALVPVFEIVRTSE